MKIAKLLLLVLLVGIIFCLAGCSSSFTGYRYLLNADGDTVTITGLVNKEDGNMLTLNIPKTLDGYQVTDIGDGAFKNCNFSYVTIPDTVKSIGNSAFEGCSELAYIEMTESVTSIGKNAFRNCPKLTQVTSYRNCEYLKVGTNPYYCLLGASNTNLNIYTTHDDTKIIAQGAFQRCSLATEIRISSGVTHIGNTAFADCSILKSVVIPESVKSIGYGAFSGSNLENIYYTGSKTMWNKITLNTFVDGITVHYNYVP